MEIRLFDLVNNKVDVRDYMFIHDGKIMVNADYVYDVILETNKVTLHQQMEMFDSKDEMLKKAKAWDNYEDSVRSLVSKYADEDTDIEKEVRDILSVYMEDDNND